MSKKNLVALVVVTLGALFGIGCTHDTANEPEVVETEKRADTRVPVTSADPDESPPRDQTTAPADACPFIPGEESIIRCLCGVCAVATTCDDVCRGEPNMGAFHDGLPWAHTPDAGDL